MLDTRFPGADNLQFEEGPFYNDQLQLAFDEAGLSPDQRLLLAVIQDAVDLLIGKTATDPATFRRTWLWLQSPSTGWPFYCRPICIELGINQKRIVEAVRPRLKNNCPSWLKGRPL